MSAAGGSCFAVFCEMRGSVVLSAVLCDVLIVSSLLLDGLSESVICLKSTNYSPRIDILSRLFSDSVETVGENKLKRSTVFNLFEPSPLSTCSDSNNRWNLAESGSLHCNCRMSVKIFLTECVCCLSWETQLLSVYLI